MTLRTGRGLYDETVCTNRPRAVWRICLYGLYGETVCADRMTELPVRTGRRSYDRVDVCAVRLAEPGAQVRFTPNLHFFYGRHSFVAEFIVE